MYTSPLAATGEAVPLYVLAVHSWAPVAALNAFSVLSTLRVKTTPWPLTMSYAEVTQPLSGIGGQARLPSAALKARNQLKPPVVLIVVTKTRPPAISGYEMVLSAP